MTCKYCGCIITKDDYEENREIYICPSCGAEVK